MTSFHVLWYAMQEEVLLCGKKGGYSQPPYKKVCIFRMFAVSQSSSFWDRMWIC